MKSIAPFSNEMDEQVFQRHLCWNFDSVALRMRRLFPAKDAPGVTSFQLNCPTTGVKEQPGPEPIKDGGLLCHSPLP